MSGKGATTVCRQGVHYFSAPDPIRRWPYEGQPCTCGEVKWEKKADRG